MSVKLSEYEAAQDAGTFSFDSYYGKKLLKWLLILILFPNQKKTIEMQKHFSFKITKVEKENTKLPVSRILDSQQRNFNELKLENSVLRKKYSELEEK